MARKEPHMSDTARIDTSTNTIREASKTEPPYNYSHGNPTDKLITLTGNVNDLCCELAAATKLTDPSYKIIAADGIKYNATNKSLPQFTPNVSTYKHVARPLRTNDPQVMSMLLIDVIRTANHITEN